MVKIKCHNCGNVWDYKGNNKFYATCYKCRFNVNIKKNVVNQEDFKLWVENDE